LNGKTFCEQDNSEEKFNDTITIQANSLKGYKKINNNESSYSENTESQNSLNSSSEKGVLINGVRWATCNVSSPGTFAKSPEEKGITFTIPGLKRNLPEWLFMPQSSISSNI